MGTSGTKGPNRELEAAKACLVLAFERRKEELYPDPDTRPKQRELAKKIGVPQPTVTHISRGKPQDIRLSTLLVLRRWIDRPLDEILGVAEVATNLVHGVEGARLAQELTSPTVQPKPPAVPPPVRRRQPRKRGNG